MLNSDGVYEFLLSADDVKSLRAITSYVFGYEWREVTYELLCEDDLMKEVDFSVMDEATYLTNLVNFIFNNMGVFVEWAQKQAPLSNVKRSLVMYDILTYKFSDSWREKSLEFVATLMPPNIVWNMKIAPNNVLLFDMCDIAVDFPVEFLSWIANTPSSME